MAKKVKQPKEAERVAFTGVDFESPVQPEKKASKKKAKKGSSKAKRGPGGRFVKAIKKATSRKKK